jgi:hypothetical protein
MLERSCCVVQQRHPTSLYQAMEMAIWHGPGGALLDICQSAKTSAAGRLALPFNTLAPGGDRRFRGHTEEGCTGLSPAGRGPAPHGAPWRRPSQVMRHSGRSAGAAGIVKAGDMAAVLLGQMRHRGPRATGMPSTQRTTAIHARAVIPGTGEKKPPCDHHTRFHCEFLLRLGWHKAAHKRQGSKKARAANRARSGCYHEIDQLPGKMDTKNHKNRTDSTPSCDRKYRHSISSALGNPAGDCGQTVKSL